MSLQIEKVIIEGPAILEKLSGEMPYKRLVGKVTYFGYLPEEEDNNLTIIGAHVFPVDIEQISIDEKKGTIEFPAYDGNYLVRPLLEEDTEWIGEENLEEARNGNF
jgi:hypothetical protein